MAQAACSICGEDIRDPLTLEEWGRHCSPRCFYQGNLRPLQNQGA